MADQEYPARRRFVKVCAAFTALCTMPRLLEGQAAPLQRHQRVRLVDHLGRPITAEELTEGQNYIFHYPYVSTPCFLLDLGQPANGGTQLRTEKGQKYRWQGGVGPRRSVVAFSAICAHRMTYPANQVSFINYRHDQTAFLDKNKHTSAQSRVIYCCSEKSVYDPAAGARVLGGPAPQPLAAIQLEYDASNGTLTALGAYGGQLFDRFVEEFQFQLAVEYGRDKVRAPVIDSTEVIPLDRYTQNQVLC